MASIPDVLRDEIDHQPLRPLPSRQTQTRNQSFSNLKSGQEIHDRINYIATFAGLTIAHNDQHRCAQLWSLLKDDRFAVAATQRARELFNWQCTDLIEIFTNIAKLEWNELLCPGTSIEQFGLDLLCRILAADIKRLYDASIEDIHANQYGVIPKNKNPMDLIFLKYTHPLTMIAPDRSHTIELVNNVQDKMNNLTYYINKLSNLTDTIQRNAKWTKKVYLGGAKPQTLSGEVIFNIKHFIAEIEHDYHGESMMLYRRYAANHRHCIHCQGTHASEDHHLSLAIPTVSNSGYPVLPLILEQIETSANDDTPHSYKKTRFSLLSQQFTFATHQKQQWPLPPRPTSPTVSRPSMGMNASSASTRKSQISSTTSRTSASPPCRPFHPAPTLPTSKNRRRSLSSSKRNAPASRPSGPSSTWLRTTMWSSKGSTKTHRSPPMQTGEHSHGDLCCNGKTHHQQMPRQMACHQHDHQLANGSSSAPHSKRHHSYNPCTEESDYDNHETPEIGDIYGDKVYNNID
jgi:hypothetical protein